MKRSFTTIGMRPSIPIAGQRLPEPAKRSHRTVIVTSNILPSTKGWPIVIEPLENGVVIMAHAEAKPFYLLSLGGQIRPEHTWYNNFDLAIERYRGLSDRENHLHAATITITLNPGESYTIVASTEPTPNLNGETADSQSLPRCRRNTRIQYRRCHNLVF
jgi:hypothetical protein